MTRRHNGPHTTGPWLRNGNSRDPHMKKKSGTTQTKQLALARCTSRHRSTTCSTLWLNSSLVLHLSHMLKHKELIHLGWTSQRVNQALGDRLRPLRDVSLQYVHRMAQKYTIKERPRDPPPGHGWKICSCPPTGAGQAAMAFGPVEDKEYLYRRAAIIHWFFHPARRTDPNLGVWAWPDHWGA